MKRFFFSVFSFLFLPPSPFIKFKKLFSHFSLFPSPSPSLSLLSFPSQFFFFGGRMGAWKIPAHNRTDEQNLPPFQPLQPYYKYVYTYISTMIVMRPYVIQSEIIWFTLSLEFLFSLPPPPPQYADFIHVRKFDPISYNVRGKENWKEKGKWKREESKNKMSSNNNGIYFSISSIDPFFLFSSSLIFFFSFYELLGIIFAAERANPSYYNPWRIIFWQDS